MPEWSDPFAPAETPVEYEARMNPPDGTIDELVSWAGQDRERAQLVLTAEDERERPRKGVYDALQGIAYPDDDAAGSEAGDGAEGGPGADPA